ncbi:hypothetical protein ABPG77_002140 [Micractinium sp. CCAP 211/92]
MAPPPDRAEPPVGSGSSSPPAEAPALHRATLPAAASRTSGHSEFRPEAMLELRDSKQELILKVQAMKKELSDWRGRISQQVEAHRGDLLDLQASLTEEMAGLRRELAGVKATIRSQLEASEAALGTLRSSGAAHPPTGAGS